MYKNILYFLFQIVICVLVAAANAGNITEIIHAIKKIQAASGGNPEANENLIDIILTYKSLKDQKKAQSLGSSSFNSNGYSLSAPPSSYLAPATSYSEPSIGYPAPNFDDSETAVSYSVIPGVSSSYSSPALSYSSPVSYSAPGLSYSPPAVNLGGCKSCQLAGISSQISGTSGGYGGGYADGYVKRW